MIDSNQINIRMLPEKRAEAFASWLRTYIDGSHEQVTLNSDQYPIIKKAAQDYDDALLRSVNQQKLYATLAAFHSYPLLDKSPNPDGNYVDHAHTVAQNKFKQALIHINNPALQEAARNAFLEASNNNEEAWGTLETLLNELRNDSTYINQQRRTAAHMELIRSMCMDPIALAPITDPFILFRLKNNIQPRIYQHDARYLTGAYKWRRSVKNRKPVDSTDPDTYSNGDIRSLPDLKSHMNAFYNNIKLDIASAPNAPLHKALDTFYKELESVDHHEYQVNTDTNTNTDTDPNSDDGNEDEDATDHDLRLMAIFGVVGAVVGALIAFAVVSTNGIFLKEKYPNDPNLSSYTVMTTEGKACGSVIMLSVMLLFICVIPPRRNPFSVANRSAELDSLYTLKAGLLGALTGACTALFTAKYIDGCVKPEYDNRGIQVDYEFTKTGEAYIACLVSVTLIIFALAINRIRQQLRQNDAVRETLRLTNNASNGATQHEDIELHQLLHVGNT